MKTYNITPIGKPRQTRSDKWKQRPVVMRYRSFCDEVRAMGIELKSSGDRIVFILPMPKSWSNKKREAMRGTPHQGKPDTDNMVKSLWDAVHKDDAHIFHIDALKFWGDEGKIIISPAREALGFDGERIIWKGIE